MKELKTKSAVKHTEIWVPKDDNGDQRIYFTNDLLPQKVTFVLLKSNIIKIVKGHDNIESYDQESNWWKFLDVLYRSNGLYAPEYDADDSVWDRISESIHCDLHKVYTDGSADLPDTFMINITPEKLKDLEAVVFGASGNHKKL